MTVVGIKSLAGPRGGVKKGIELPPELAVHFTNGSCFEVKNTPTGLLFRYMGENIKEVIRPAPRPSWLPSETH